MRALSSRDDRLHREWISRRARPARVSPAFRYRLWEDVTKLKLAMVGCGAITEVIHLPVASASPGFRVAGLVDTRHEYAQGLASSYGVEWTASDYREAIGRVDAVLLA